MAKPGVGKYSEIKGTKSGYLSRQEEDRGCMMKNMMKRSTYPEQLHRAWAQEPARPIAGHEKWSLVYQSLEGHRPEPVLSWVRLGPTAWTRETFQFIPIAPFWNSFSFTVTLILGMFLSNSFEVMTQKSEKETSGDWWSPRGLDTDSTGRKGKIKGSAWVSGSMVLLAEVGKRDNLGKDDLILG